ncbi:MAG: HlyD family type I secretion periplasmic adaptor subunit [Pseudomonadota bacterium]
MMNPGKIIAIGIFVVISFFGGLGGWAALSKISGAVIAPGEIQVDSNRKTVQHLEGGIVREILVREGSQVNAGDVLIRLEAEQIWASRDMNQGQLDALAARRGRLVAEKEHQSSIRWPAEILKRLPDANVAELTLNEEKIFQSRRSARDTQISLIDAQIEQLRIQVQSGEEQLVSLEKMMASMDEEIRAKRELLEGRYIEKSQIMELERALEGHKLQKGQIVGNNAQARQRVAELRLRIEEVRNKYQQEAVEELGKVQGGIFELEDRIRPLADASRRLDIVAPVSGIVMDLKVHSLGGVIAPREPLMDIVPLDNPLIVSTKVDVRKIAEVHLGQEASVMLSAFKQRITPKVKGSVTYISADRLLTSTAQGAMPYFLVHIILDRESLHEAIGDVSRLSAGMPAEVFIVTKDRTVMHYILEPLILSTQRAFRES